MVLKKYSYNHNTIIAKKSHFDNEIFLQICMHLCTDGTYYGMVNILLFMSNIEPI
jgi:hypothetical protein